MRLAWTLVALVALVGLACESGSGQSSGVGDSKKDTQDLADVPLEWGEVSDEPTGRPEAGSDETVSGAEAGAEAVTGSETVTGTETATGTDAVTGTETVAEAVTGTPTTVAAIQQGDGSVNCDGGPHVVAQGLQLTGVVLTTPQYSASTNLHGYYVSDAGTAAQWTGVQVVIPKTDGTAFQPGERLDLVGEQKEYYCMTEVTVTAWQKVAGAPVAVQPLDVALADLGQDDPAAERYEGVLVRVGGGDVTLVDQHQEVVVGGSLRIGNDFGLAYLGDDGPKGLGDHVLSVTGVVNFKFGHYVVMPRSESDLVVEVVPHPEATAEPAPEVVEEAAQEAVAEVGPVTGVVINELMRNPDPIADATGEWVELYNAGDQAVDLSGWSLNDDGGQKVVLSPAAPLVLDPGQYLVVGNSADPALNGGVAEAFAYDGNKFQLGNSDDEVVLKDPSGAEVDRVNVVSAFPSPKGASIALKNPALDNNAAASWAISTASFGTGQKGTPGAKNSDVFQ